MSAVPAVAVADTAPAHLPARTIPVAAGDGIGPEIMDATLSILAAADPALRFHHITVGLKAYEGGLSAGIGDDAWTALDEHGVILKGPVMTPTGEGYKSVNVTLRKTLGLYANLRPCVAYHPYVKTRHPLMDLVVIRENEEDTYAGIEHRQSEEVYQCLKLITRPGCERIVRYAFEYARAHGRRKVTCMTKSNIMKLTDGLFQRVFEEIAREYGDIESDHMIIDIGAARIATRPTDFDVVVAPNLYGDILSDIAAEVAGSIGLAGSANIGEACAMFEAVHGSAPDIAGRDAANPTGLLLSAVMMLVHMGRPQPAAAIHNALLRTLEDGVHTADIWRYGISSRKVGTRDFAAAVIDRLGIRPQILSPVDYPDPAPAAPARSVVPIARPRPAEKRLVGVDVFLNWDESGRAPAELGRRLEAVAGPDFRLSLITNRGVKVYPGGNRHTLCTDHWRCRFPMTDTEAGSGAIASLLVRIADAGLDAVKTENLYEFDGVRAYSQAQGE
jgi:isocitrate dehydrogenase